MRILLSNYRYFMSGGPEKYLFTALDALGRAGHAVLPFSVQSPNNQPTEFEEEFLSAVAAGTYFDDYPRTLQTALKVLSRQFYSLEGYRKARRFALAHQVDIAYSLHFLNKMSPSVLDGFRAAGIPVVVRISDFGWICPEQHLFDGTGPCTLCVKGDFRHAIAKRCVRRSSLASGVKAAAIVTHRLIGAPQRVDAYVFPSRSTLDLYAEAGFPKDRLHYLPTPIAFDAPPPTRLGTRMLFFGRVSPEKGVHHLLEAQRRLGKKALPLTVIGTGDDAYAADLVASYPNVEFHPFLENKALSRFIADAVAVVVPSIWYDNLPNVVLEAYAHGKPVIAPAHGSFVGLVDEGRTGLLFRPADVDHLAKRMTWAAEHPTEMLSMGQNGRRVVEEQYSTDRHFRDLGHLFEGLLERAPHLRRRRLPD